MRTPQQRLDEIETYRDRASEASARCGGRAWVRATSADAECTGLMHRATILVDRAGKLGKSHEESAQRLFMEVAMLEVRAEQLADLATAMVDLDQALITVASELAQATDNSEMGTPEGVYYSMWKVAHDAIERLVVRATHLDLDELVAIRLVELAVEILADCFEIRYDYRWEPADF